MVDIRHSSTFVILSFIAYAAGRTPAASPAAFWQASYYGRGLFQPSRHLGDSFETHAWRRHVAPAPARCAFCFTLLLLSHTLALPYHWAHFSSMPSHLLPLGILLISLCMPSLCLCITPSPAIHRHLGIAGL